MVLVIYYYVMISDEYFCSGSTPLRTGSLAPGQQISMDKLVVALQYLGYNPTPEQLQTLKSKLHIDADNKVFLAFN